MKIAVNHLFAECLRRQGGGFSGYGVRLVRYRATVENARPTTFMNAIPCKIIDGGRMCICRIDIKKVPPLRGGTCRCMSGDDYFVMAC